MALTEKLTAIADAIRVQSGKSEKLTLDQMPTEIIDLQSLAFEVVGNPQPENPKENTIWVDTDTPITSWIFSATQPLLDGEDLYATAEKKAGYYLDASGNEVKNEDHEILTIDLPEGTTHIIVTGAHYATSTVAHCFYGASGNFISSVLRNNGTFEYAVPSEAKSVRVTLKPNDARSVIVCDSSKQEGRVWISTGASSPVEFNALKKNCVQVYPLSAKQYIGGSFVSKSAEIYQSGAWNGFVTYLYKKGDVCTDLTGGWKVRGWSWSTGTNGEHATVPTATYNDSSVKLYQKTSSSTNRWTGIWETVSDIDLTNFDTISFHVISSSLSSKSSVRFGAFNRSGGSSASSAKAYVEITSGSSSEKTYTVDVSALTGSYSIGVMLAAYTTDVTIYVDEIKLLKN